MLTASLQVFSTVFTLFYTLLPIIITKGGTSALVFQVSNVPTISM